MKHILVPCDFSKPSTEAFKVAVDLAVKSKATVTVLHVIYLSTVYDPGFVGEPVIFNQQFFTSIEEDAKKGFAEMQKLHGKNQSISLQITVGGLLESINRITEEKGVDLIVMGTTGASGIQEVLIGSNTEKVVRFSGVPVLSVPYAIDVNAIKNILLPTTCDLDQSRFISRLKNLQSFLKARLHVLLINTPSHFMCDEEGMEALEEFVKHYHLTDYELYFKSYRVTEEGIVDFATSNKIDLIAMATHSRKGLAHLFTGSVTENIVNRLPAPVWSYSIRK